MNRIRRIVPALLAVATLSATEACRRQQAPTPVPTPVNADSARLAEEARVRDSIAAAQRAAEAEREAARQDSIRRANEAAAAEATALRTAITAPIYFDFDRSEIRDDSRAALEAKVPVLLANSGLRIRIAGHTDERGSTEYNLALGQRRATAAKRYLVERGVAEDRIETVSFGEEQPAAQGSDESAWQQNRRDEFEITAGGDRLVRPRTQ